MINYSRLQMSIASLMLPREIHTDEKVKKRIIDEVEIMERLIICCITMKGLLIYLPIAIPPAYHFL